MSSADRLGPSHVNIMNWKLLAIGIVGAAVGFMLEAPGPIGKMIWPMAEGLPEPEGSNLALLMLMGGLEAIAFGAGVVFLVAGYPLVKARLGGSTAWSWASYLSIAWILMNWVAHTSMHMAHGNILTPADFGGLVVIEYVFHLTLMLAGAVLAIGTVRYVRDRAGTSTPPATRPTTSARRTV